MSQQCRIGVSEVSKLKNYEPSKYLWLHGCHGGGKTYAVKEIFREDSLKVFEYPSNQEEGESSTNDVDMSAINISDFVKAFLNYLDTQFRITEVTYSSYTNFVEAYELALDTTSNRIPEAARRLVRIFYEFYGIDLGKFVWLIKADKLHYELVNAIGHFHKKVTKECLERHTVPPRLIFESWFPYLSTKRAVTIDSNGQAHIVGRRSAKVKTIKSGIRDKNLMLLSDLVSIQFLPMNRRKEDMERYSQMFVRYVSYEENEDRLKLLSSVVDNWAGFHYGLRRFIFTILDLYRQRISLASNGDVKQIAEDSIEEYLGNNDMEVGRLLEKLACSLEIHWHQVNGSTTPLKYVENGIVYPQTTYILLIKKYLDIMDLYPPQTELSHQYNYVVKFIKEWSNENGEMYIGKEIINNNDKQVYTEDNWSELMEEIVQYISNREFLSRERLSNFWGEFVRPDREEFRALINQGQPDYIAEKIFYSAVRKNKLSELTKQIFNYRLEEGGTPYE